MLGILVWATFLTLLWSQPVASQPTDDLKAMRKDIEALKEGQKRIQRELETIKTLLRQRQAPQARGRRTPQPFQPVVLSIGDEPFKGDRNAKVTIIDFSDYQ
jgi:protein-disulfide isomerase